ncbi:MAG TPA: heparinase II/III family protein [Verrucomicrobiota bacterium]|nr:heparinase II/III family protein [Verrucomicrobiota bacterium]HNU51592.1 heparinase II/III family protein [Verrucomicrobiota bacterium]
MVKFPLGGLRILSGLWLACTLRVAAADAAPAVPIPDGPDLLKTLRSGHPRLLATAEDFDRLKSRAATDPILKGWHERLRARAQEILKSEPSKYEIPDGLRLLSVSRRVLDRVYVLGLLWRLEGGGRYLDRVARELDAAAAFADWNPRHFLDTAEMTHAFAIAYDWLYDGLTEEQRGRWRGAILEKGLKLGVGCHRGTEKFGGWTRSRHNWNQVCNGGIGMGALAVADVEPGLAGEFLSPALRSLQLAMREYGPDGAWAEGPGYWNYATSYNGVILAALQTALGTDFGLSGIAGFAEAGLFPVYATGPTGRTFNYADGGDGAIRAPVLWWLARRFERPAYGRYQLPLAAPHAQDLLWYDPSLADTSGAAEELPLDRHFRRAEMVCLRSAWNDRNAVFLGFKAGDNKANHSNLDLGTFVLDALGVRWLVDLGADNYNLPAYFGGQRWTYYRLRAEGHNTLVINPTGAPDQDPKAAAVIGRFVSRPERSFAVADLTAAYARQAGSVKRGIELRQRRQVLVQDEIESAQPAEVWWFAHTAARVALADGDRGALLTADGKRLRVQLIEPEEARFAVLDARPLPSSPQPEGQNANRGVQKLAVHLPAVRRTRVAVQFTPLTEADPTAPTPVIRPLAEW